MKDAYTALKDLARRRLAGHRSGEKALAELEADPERGGSVLEAELMAVGARDDQAMVDSAQRLLGLLDAAGSRSGKYAVDVRGAQGVQVGDHNIQANTFSTPPPSSD
ncbi:hypothetical protein [Flindersiella endophytica]